MLRLDKKEIIMYGYISWPGVYSFKEEIGLLLEYLREQIDEVMKKIEETEDLVAKQTDFLQAQKLIRICKAGKK